MLVPIVSLIFVVTTTRSNVLGFHSWSTPSAQRFGVEKVSRLLAVDPDKEAIALEEASKYAPDKYPTTSAKPIDDGFAKAMTAYMAKSHEDKLKKQKILKEKDDEIEDLKAQLQEMTELADSYQRCLADTIVRYETQLATVDDSSESVTAVEAPKTTTTPVLKTASTETATPVAEVPAAPSAPAPAPAAPAAPVLSLYQQRNARLKKSAVAGKSRWGNAEIMKMGGIAQRIQMMPGKDISSAAVPSPETIAEADHGLWREGIMALADRVTYGADLIFAKPTIEEEASSTDGDASGSTTTTGEGSSSLYEKRNAKLLEVAESGKSRWGVDEINRVKDLVAGVDQPGVAAATVTENPGVKTTNDATSAVVNGTPKPTSVEEVKEKVAVAAAATPSKEASPSVASAPTPKPAVKAHTGQANYFSDNIAYGSGWGNYGSGY